jgi:short-subunit dehydrogenase
VELAGTTALLTGATGGLGRAIAAALAERGATIVLSSRKEKELSVLSDSLPGGRHRFVVGDLADDGEAERIVAKAGDVDILVANAGRSAGGMLETLSLEETVGGLRVNLESPVRMARAVLPAMRDRGRGHLVFISSLQGKVAFPRSSIYSATKFGIRGFALSLREDLIGTGVGVSVVLPGFIREAGMFAASGRKAPAGLGTSSPAEVGEGVVDAIERDRAEVAVAPLLQRLGANFAHRRPQIAARMTRGSAGKVADEVNEGRSGQG